MYLTTDLTYVEALHTERVNPNPQSTHLQRRRTASRPSRARLIPRVATAMTRRLRTVSRLRRALGWVSGCW